MTGGAPIPIERDRVTRAKMIVARWFDSTEQPAELRSKILSGVEAIAAELQHRADWFEVTTVKLNNSAELRAQISERQYRIFPCSDSLAITTVVPGWGFGWRTVLKNEDVYQILTWLLHYSRQYIHRAYVTNALMIVWEKHRRSLHAFGSEVLVQRYSPGYGAISIDASFDVAMSAALEVWGRNNNFSEIPKSVSTWAQSNMLDPFLHEAAFHFLRAQNLLSNDFLLETIVAFDCVRQSIIALIKTREKLATEPNSKEVCQRLQLSGKHAETLEYLSFIRNNFGAHPGGWRWWDHYELIDDDDISEIADSIEKVLSAAAVYEMQLRVVQPFPSHWANWFFDNFEIIWNAVWFEKEAKWNKQQTSG